ncbi:acyl-CoA thioesterase [Rhodococcus erythropolis]|uniref:acyl-CoA thioesterase n=1 Tax=Rhodococcus erythropolis TaxID=1833 RepID=UPI00379CFB6E
MTETSKTLLALLNVEPIDDHLFLGRAVASGDLPRLFGGQVAGQALAAAARTVSADRPPHSMHSHFLRPGEIGVPIEYSVDTVREGRTFSTRHVVARQGAKTLFTMDASFSVAETGLDHQVDPPIAPDPDNVRTLLETMRLAPDDWPSFYSDWGSMDIRPIDLSAGGGASSAPNNTRAQFWFRAIDRLPDELVLHSCILACVSDLTLLAVAFVPHGIVPVHPGFQAASLDHTVWFHRPFRLDDWLLYDQNSPSAFGARALACGRLFDREGKHVATVAQEGMVRPIRPASVTPSELRESRQPSNADTGR